MRKVLRRDGKAKADVDSISMTIYIFRKGS